MIKFLPLIILGIFSGRVIAQDSLYILHPIIGNHFEKEAKKKYYLFPEIRDSLFNYGEIHIRGGKYFLESHFNNDSVSVLELQKSQLDLNYTNVEKLNEYYSNKNKNDTIEKVNLNQTDPQINKELVAPGLSKELKDEIERDYRLKQDQEQMKNYMQGKDAFPVNIEIYNSSKKKKK